MPRQPLQSVVQYLHRIIDVGPGAASDADLLERFAANRDESAFALLVYRHGPLVLGVCRRVLHHEHDCEDVFQATFLALARRANSISKKDSLASWLYKVAYRIACRARGKVPMLTNQGAALQGQAEPDADLIWRDLRPVLDQEIAQLPASQSRPIILCYLEGKTHEEAAKLLGWPKGTLAARLARGRERLRQRLTRRGWTLSAAVLATVLADKAGATAISAELMRSTVQAALAYVSGTSVAVLSAKAVALAEGVLQMMWYSKVKMVVVMLLAVALTGSGVGWAMFAGGAGPEQAAQKPKVEPPGDAKAESAALRDQIAKLRADLDAALEENKRLKAGQVGRAPLYRGKPLSYYFDQYKDLDPAFRGEAIQVIGIFAQKDRSLIPLLIDALKDNNHYYVGDRHAQWVSQHASEALAELGDGAEIAPLVLALFKQTKSTDTKGLAATLLVQLDPDPKKLVPEFSKALKDDLAVPFRSYSALGLRDNLAQAFKKLGPGAKPALPLLAETLLQTHTDVDKLAKKQGLTISSYTYGDRSLLVVLLDAIVAADPEVAKLLPEPSKWRRAEAEPESPFSKKKVGGFSPRPRALPENIEGTWQTICQVIRERYKVVER